MNHLNEDSVLIYSLYVAFVPNLDNSVSFPINLKRFTTEKSSNKFSAENLLRLIECERMQFFNVFPVYFMCSGGDAWLTLKIISFWWDFDWYFQGCVVWKVFLLMNSEKNFVYCSGKNIENRKFLGFQQFFSL